MTGLETICAQPDCGLPWRLHGDGPGEDTGRPTRSTHRFRTVDPFRLTGDRVQIDRGLLGDETDAPYERDAFRGLERAIEVDRALRIDNTSDARRLERQILAAIRETGVTGPGPYTHTLGPFRPDPLQLDEDDDDGWEREWAEVDSCTRRLVGGVLLAGAAALLVGFVFGRVTA